MIRDQEILDQLVDLVDRFVRERLIPAEQQVAEDLRIPDDIVQEMKALGLFGMTIPEEYGGLGLTLEEEIHVAMTLGQTSPAVRSILGTNNGIGSAAVVFDGTEEQKQRFLPRYASGELIGCFCLTEPDVGSDAAAVKATARRASANSGHARRFEDRSLRRALHGAGDCAPPRCGPERQHRVGCLQAVPPRRRDQPDSAVDHRAQHDQGCELILSRMLLINS
jgi:hypothetical protein